MYDFHSYLISFLKHLEIGKGAELMGAVGALAPTVFLPRPEIIYISVPLFLPRPEVVFYTCTHAI